MRRFLRYKAHRYRQHSACKPGGTAWVVQESGLLSVVGRLLKGALVRVPEPAETIDRFGTADQKSLPRDLSVLVWNIQKSNHPNWAADFRELGASSDLMLLQEVALDDHSRQDLKAQAKTAWSVGKACLLETERAQLPLGVAVGARATPAEVGYSRSDTVEPVVPTPKISLLSTFPVADSDQNLLVVNVHAVNFVGSGPHRAQIQKLAETIAAHPGPVILAGDFNTWSTRRLTALREIAGLLGLEPVLFENDPKREVLGVIDHAFVRGIDVVEARVEDSLTSSDHYPLRLQLRIKQP